MIPKNICERFEADYSGEEKELLVLISEDVPCGASTLQLNGEYQKGVLNPRAKFLACVDTKTGKLTNKTCVLNWICEDKHRGYGFKLKPMSICKIKCRAHLNGTAAAKGLDKYLLTKIVKRKAKNGELENLLKKYKLPLEIQDELCGKFTLERRYSRFTGTAEGLSEGCTVSLSCDEEGGETAQKALSHYKTIYGSLTEWESSVRKYAAAQISEYASEWQAEAAETEEELRPITEEEFAERISIYEFEIDTDGAFTAYYDDDDMFSGHTVVVQGNLNGKFERADIWG